MGLRRENKAEVKKKMVEKGFRMRGIGSRVYISTKENSKRRRKNKKGFLEFGVGKESEREMEGPCVFGVFE